MPDPSLYWRKKWKKMKEEKASTLDDNSNRNVFNTFVAAVADLFGLSALGTLDEFGYADMNEIRKQLKQMRNRLLDVYNAYPERATYLTKDNMTLGQLEELLKNALNEQSDFSRWALSYSPVSSAYKAFHEHANALAHKVNEATSRSSRAEADYTDATAQMNARQVKAGQLIDKVDRLDADMLELRDTTALEKTNASYQDLANSVRDEAAKTINQVQTYEKEQLKNND